MRSRRAGSGFKERFNVWPGFTDVMVGLLLVFVFVVTLFTITQTVLSRFISQKDNELERAKEDLTLRSSELEKLSRELARLEKLFADQKNKSETFELLLLAKQKEIHALVADIQEKTEAVDSKDKAIEARGEELRQALERISAKDEELNAKQQQIDAALRRMEQVASAISEREHDIYRLRLKLTATERSLESAGRESSDKDRSIADLRAKIQMLNDQVAALNGKITGYIVEVDRLNRLVGEAKAMEGADKAKTASLQKEIVSLTSKLDDLSKKMQERQNGADHQFRLAQLVNLLGEKDQEIDRLRKLSKYRSEFLAKLETVFSGISDIKVQGDRFVFQSEILFASGKTEINESGQQELDKFAGIYKEMVPKMPTGVDIIILVQGHTDIDPVRSSRFLSNWELSSARALQVVRYLIQKGIPPTRLGASGYGEFHPVNQAASAEAKRLNRRIEIKISTL